MIITFGRPRNDQERAGANKFVREQYEKYYGVTPDISDDLFVACHDGRLIGTITTQKVEAAHAPLSFLYDIPSNSLPGSLDQMAQMGRFVGRTPLARPALSCGAARVALKEGQRWALVEAKPITAQRHGIDEVKMHLVVGATLKLERVERHVRHYYESVPSPALYTIELEPMERTYSAVLERAGAQLELI